jgi:hypothetical protein
MHASVPADPAAVRVAGEADRIEFADARFRTLGEAADRRPRLVRVQALCVLGAGPVAGLALLLRERRMRVGASS